MNLFKLFKTFLIDQFIFGFGGDSGGGGAPTQSTSYNTNLPEYAKPYVTNMLETTQRQLFDTRQTPSTTNAEGVTTPGSTEITGFKPYKPYSSNVNDYFAGFSPMQQQAQRDTSGLSVPGQYQTATGMTGLAGLGALGTARDAGQYGAAGAMQGLGFGQQAQDPNAVQAYMNPYLQASLNPQLAEIQRQYDTTGQQQQGAAARSGAFGGSREALMASENQRNAGLAKNQVIGQGYNTAFNNAQQQMATAAQLGMQGAGLGLQGIGAQQAGYGQFGQMANQLAGIGGQQLAAKQGIISAQNQMGAQQQAAEQQKINQSIQDYATQQQYPLMQLGFMSNMLRGLPMQATTTQSYQAQPSALNQGLGVLAGAAGAKQAGLFAEGGTIKGLAEGGVTRYANTGMVQGNPDSAVVRGIQAKLQMMSPEQLQQVAKTSPSEEIRTMALQMLQEYKVREQAEQQAKNSIMQDQKAMPTPVSQGVGLPAAPAPSLDGMASGGIIAFADEGQVSLNPDDEALLRQKYITAAQKQREALGLDASQTPRKEYYAKEAEDIARTKEENKGKYLMDLGLGLAGSTGNFIPSVARAASAAGVAAESRKESARSREGQLAKGLADIAEGERLIKLGDVTAGNAMYEKGAERINKVQVAGIKPKDTNQKDYANAYVAAAKAKGDKREEAIIYAEGTDKYVNAVQASRFAQVGVGATNATTQAQEFGSGLYATAATQVEKILKNFRSLEGRKYDELVREDRKNGTNNSAVYRDTLINNTLEGLKRSGGISANTGASTNANTNTGTGGKPPPPDFVLDKKPTKG